MKQTAAPTKTPPRRAARDTVDLEAELEALFATIENREPGCVPKPGEKLEDDELAGLSAQDLVDSLFQKVTPAPPEAPEASTPSEFLAQSELQPPQPLAAADAPAAFVAPEELDDAEPTPPAGAESQLVEMDDLAAELQALLNGGGAAPTPAVEEDAPPAAFEPPTDEDRAAAAEMGSDLPDTDASSSIAELDALLAQTANQAVEEVRTQDAIAPDADPRPDADPDVELIDHPVTPPADAGAFEAPTEEEVAALLEEAKEVVEPAAHATAPAAEAAAASPVPEPVPESDAATCPSAMARLRRVFAKLAALAAVAAGPAYLVLSLVNRPLERLSPEMRSTVGYVAIVTLFNALCLILYSALA